MRFTMKSSLSALAAAVLLASPLVSFAQGAAPAGSQAGPAPYSVFVDQPTGFTFVKLPGGWKFAGSVTPEEAQHLPDTVLTSVLPAESQQEIRTAAKGASLK
jgi:hypothetical protein